MVIFALSGCSSEDTAVAPDDNQSPSITYKFGKMAVGRNTQSTLAVSVEDPDDDPVTVTWRVSRDGADSGTLLSAQGDTLMNWEAPGTIGIDTITVTASDGRGGESQIVETVIVATPKAANITSGTVVWGKSQSPYIVSSPTTGLAIANVATLVVEAGVELYIDKAGMQISVNGTLQVSGTAAEPVLIRPSAAKPAPGFWVGVVAVPDNSVPLVTMSYATMSHAESAVSGVNQAVVHLDGCVVRFCSESAVFFGATGAESELRVENSALTNNIKSAIQVKTLLTPPALIVVRGDSIAVNGDLPEYTEEAGISLDFNDPDGVVTVDIANNEISRNNFTGIYLAGAVFPVINNNGIFGNERPKTNRIDLRLESGFNGNLPLINAENNFWGQAFTQASDIKELVWDKEDDPSIDATVDVDPWLNTAP